MAKVLLDYRMCQRNTVEKGLAGGSVESQQQVELNEVSGDEEPPLSPLVQFHLECDIQENMIAPLGDSAHPATPPPPTRICTSWLIAQSL